MQRRARTITTLSTVLIVGLIIATTVILFTNRSRPLTNLSNIQNASIGNRDKTPLTISTQKNGIQFSAAITPGPYFLGEMLGINLTVTNHTQNTIYTGIPFIGSPCGYFSGIVISGGNGPRYPLSINFDHSCPPSFSPGSALQAGKSTTVHTYEPLLSSGLLTLTAQTQFLKHNVNTNKNRFFMSQSIDPLNGNWPTTHIQVSPDVPADRQILLKQDGEHVSVNGPPGAQSDLVYAYGLSCGSIATGDETGTGNYAWNKLVRPTEPVSPPQDSYCSGKKISWTYVFAAPGYALTSGTFHSA
ncbi:hypothetical protein [Dictyobacter arantiisoli]|uniref:Uncharacterized protein n=1 Tax=Dictyobacter arantiisoli TaxID=2014874 RepID=A0A5A5TJ79_9CHLR|nr:hypothetical protein [Dictyobacter arantiisoli]GCF11285.1 hypothetical protein KDI_48490 [Dictyobacter arantiisoli]